MPHQCVRCSKLHEDGSDQLLKGCECGGKLFYYIKKESLKAMQEELPKLSPLQQQEVERDVREIIGDASGDKPVILDVGNIHVKEPGKYELDLVQLFKGEPLVFKVEDGKYLIDLAETFSKFKKKQ